MNTLFEVSKDIGIQIHENIYKSKIFSEERCNPATEGSVTSFTKAAGMVESGLGEEFLNKLKRSFSDNHHLIVRNIGSNLLNLEDTDQSIVMNALLIGMTKNLGFNTYGFKQEKNGAIIHDILPIEGKEDKVSSEGVIEFGLHADGAYLDREIRPQTLSLLCIDNTAKTSTRLVKIDDIIEKLTYREIEILSEDRYIHTPPDTFKVNNESKPKPILEKINGSYELRVATHNYKAIDSEANIVFEKFSNIANQLSFEHDWLEGDLLIFNNFKTLHGRGEIVGKRHLRRCYGSSYQKDFNVLDLS